MTTKQTQSVHYTAQLRRGIDKLTTAQARIPSIIGVKGALELMEWLLQEPTATNKRNARSIALTAIGKIREEIRNGTEGTTEYTILNNLEMSLINIRYNLAR